MSFTHLTVWRETEATGEVYLQVGVEYRNLDHGGLELLAVEEVEIDGTWLSFQQLQARGYRTLAHEIALAAEWELDSDPDQTRRLWWQAEEEAAEPWGGERD